MALVSANLTWTASTDPSVTGYNIYFGGSRGQYTNMVSVATVTNAVVADLSEGVTYFFAARAHNAADTESPFSNEALFCGLTVSPGTCVQQCAIPTNSTGDQLTFSLAGNAPAGATIDSTNGVFVWRPGLDDASTTNVISVTITDNTNPSLSSSETLLVVVTDYLQTGLGSTTAQAGQSAALPISWVASDEITNLQVKVAWPTGLLGTPTLTFAPPVVAGSLQMQDAAAVVTLQVAPGQSSALGHTVAQLNFQAPPGQPSAFVDVPVTAVGGIKSDGAWYRNVTAESGQVVLVGSSPLLQLQRSAAQSHSLTLFGSPGISYQVQMATNLAPPVVWVPLLNHQQINVSDSLDLDDPQPTTYYRLRQLDSGPAPAE